MLRDTVPFLLEFTFLPAICLPFPRFLLLHHLSLTAHHNRPHLPITTTSSPSSPCPKGNTSLSHSKHDLSSPNSLTNSASYATSSATHWPTCLPYHPIHRLSNPPIATRPTVATHYIKFTVTSSRPTNSPSWTISCLFKIKVLPGLTPNADASALTSSLPSIFQSSRTHPGYNATSRFHLASTIKSAKSFARRSTPESTNHLTRRTDHDGFASPRKMVKPFDQFTIQNPSIRSPFNIPESFLFQNTS